MVSFDEVKGQLEGALAALTAIDAKLDEIRDFIAGLQAGQVFTQEQLDELGALAGAAKTSAENALEETDSLDDTEEEPTT